MYEDTWYSIVPETKPNVDESKGHRRRQSLLKQPNETDNTDSAPPLDPLLEEPSYKGPPEATVARRAKSYTDFYHVARAQITKDAKEIKEKERRGEAHRVEQDDVYMMSDDDLLEASIAEFQLYRDQLALSERHLDTLLEDTSSALDLLSSLSSSFKAVEAQTTAFQSQCEDLLQEQKRLRNLADEVGHDLGYYTYLEPTTRRLNAPGAATSISDDSYVEIMQNLDSCIEFMRTHQEHKEAEAYLTRYQSLLTKTHSLLQIAYTNTIRSKTSEARAILAKAAKITTTTVFLVQAPDNHPTDGRLEGSIEHIIDTARPIFDPAIRYTPQPQGRDKESAAAAAETYYTLLKSLTDEYTTSRRGLITDVLHSVLTSTLVDEYPPSSDFGKYARAALNTTLEIVLNEYGKYALFFTGPRSSAHRATSEFHRIWKTQVTFNRYLEDLCGQAFRILEPWLGKEDVGVATQVVVWLDSYVAASVEDGGDGGDADSVADTYRTEGGGETEIKTHLAGLLRRAVVQGVWGRVRERLYAGVTRFQPKPQDFILSNDSDKAKNEEKGLVAAEEPADSDIEGRAVKALGPSFLNAYPPLKLGIHLLILNNDLGFNAATNQQSLPETAYEIIHETAQSILRGSAYLPSVQTLSASQATKPTPLDPPLFTLRHLLHLHHLLLAYEISGSRKAAALDFSRVWNSLASLRERGSLFSLGSYYELLRKGELLPRVVETVEDARVELDGLLREAITRFRTEAAKSVQKKSEGEGFVRSRLELWFPDETVTAGAVNAGVSREVRDNLWRAVEETVRDEADGRKGAVSGRR